MPTIEAADRDLIYTQMVIHAVMIESSNVAIKCDGELTRWQLHWVFDYTKDWFQLGASTFRVTLQRAFVIAVELLLWTQNIYDWKRP